MGFELWIAACETDAAVQVDTDYGYSEAATAKLAANDATRYVYWRRSRVVVGWRRLRGTGGREAKCVASNCGAGIICI